MSFSYLQFSQKANEKIRLHYYGTSSRFLGVLKTPKRHFEINWPLALKNDKKGISDRLKFVNYKTLMNNFSS